MSKVFQVFALVMSLALIGVMGAFSPLMAVKVEKVAIEPEDKDASIPNSKKNMKITLNQEVKAVRVSYSYLDLSQGMPIDPDSISSQRVKIIEKATGSGKKWSVNTERLIRFWNTIYTRCAGCTSGYDDEMREVLRYGLSYPTIEWTKKDGSDGAARITVHARIKRVRYRNDIIEDRFISVRLISQ